jgi:hypothetical protein
VSDPTRWRTDPARRPRGADLLLRGARRPQPPASGALERLGARVDAIPRLSAARARRWARVMSAAAAGVTLLALATGVWAWRGQRRSAPPAAPTLWAAARAPEAIPTLGAAPAASDEPQDQPQEQPQDRSPEPVRAPARRRSPARRTVAHLEASRREHRARVATVEPIAVDADTLAREINLVDAARDELPTAPARALAALDTHRREFPRGQLAAEREFLAVEALRRMNRIDEARRRAVELQDRYPSSSYAARASRLLKSP